jgi:hypothetical protein
MKSGFKDPDAIKKQVPNDKPVDGKNTPWDYRCPQYDQRSSCFVKAGTNYGVGLRQPVGTETHTNESIIPKGRVNTMRIDETYG